MAQTWTSEAIQFPHIWTKIAEHGETDSGLCISLQVCGHVKTPLFLHPLIVDAYLSFLKGGQKSNKYVLL